MAVTNDYKQCLVLYIHMIAIMLEDLWRRLYPGVFCRLQGVDWPTSSKTPKNDGNH